MKYAPAYHQCATTEHIMVSEEERDGFSIEWKLAGDLRICKCLYNIRLEIQDREFVGGQLSQPFYCIIPNWWFPGLSMICDAFALCSPFILTRMECLPMLGCDSVSLNLLGRAGPTQQN